ncbi:MAG: NAD(P)H-hydrate dehydratase [Candidatus Methanomethylophilaceae archaeon]|jgi:hydroxyethylthiazole kinase-like uncharacterized protein yjeF
MITRLESRILDINSEALGISTESLMDNAGAALASVLEKRYGGEKFLFVCGTGNNGGDGFAAAGKMSGDVSVCLLKPADKIKSEISLKYFSKLECPVLDFGETDFGAYGVLVDCALGTGSEGRLRSPYSEYAEKARSFSGTVVSADIPSGLGSDGGVKPELTVCFHDVKEGMTPENSGEIIVADIGIPREASDTVGPGDMLRYPVPEKDSHKGRNGRVLLIGGGPYYGAPAMAGAAALRVGADLTVIAVPDAAAEAVSAFSPVFIVKNLGGNVLTPDSVPYLSEISKNYDTVLIGPGLGTDEKTVKAVKNFVSGCSVPLVIDADAITALGSDFRTAVPAVLTPHRGEFLRLGGKTVTEEEVERVARSLNSVILAKGNTDIVSNGVRTRKNVTGTPAMTGAGTGDVLAGTVAGLVSKGMEPFHAACLGAYICGRAGEYAFSDKSYGLIATDVLEKIPKVLSEELKE